MVQAQINVDAFRAVINELPNEEMERVALAFPNIWGKDCFDFGEPGANGVIREVATPPKRSVKPKAERKSRAAKEPTEAEQKADRAVLAFVAENNGSRSAEITLNGIDKDQKNAALKRLVAAGMLRLEGKAGAARYYVVYGTDREAGS